ncbi:unnamed protein product [Blepharisma stoltei]|uniref:Guanylate cyclase domain-containing protein n=1 Tax=Blepharisma stoltei TaxID=1481888 RepID=A0AAU9J483_9CILI|nr:unnamed protein product [Blepharisma stoltei]
MHNLHNLNINPKDKPKDVRTIHLLNSNFSKHWSRNNEITTARYNFWNFIPKNVFEQFHQLWYSWFLLILILDLTYSSSIEKSFTDVFPFCIILLIRISSDGFHDLRRHKFDNEINNREFKVLTNDGEIIKKNKNICVGDVIVLHKDQKAPADMIVICTWENKTKFYVDVTDIIGEVQYDPKKPARETKIILKSLDLCEIVSELNKLNVVIKVPESPSFKFWGSIRLRTGPKPTSLSEMNYIKSGSKILEIEWVIGVVVYTHREIKKFKRRYAHLSLLEKKLNKMVIIVAILASIMIVVSVILNIFVYGLKFGDNTWSLVISTIFLFRRLTPPSLLISIKFIQLYFTHGVAKKIPGVKFNSLKVSEELGQVEYILTDKTGTLTSNEVELPICIMDGETYLRDRPMYETEASPHNNAETEREMFIDYDCKSFFDLRRELMSYKTDYPLAYYFVMCMGVCHQSWTTGQMCCNTWSMEDKAMVDTSSSLGLDVVTATKEKATLTLFNQEIILDILTLKGYSENIQKSRIIVKDNFKGEIILYVKGTKAEMLRSFNVSKKFRHYIELNGYETQLSGKKTVFLGYRILNESELEDFVYEYNIAKISPVNSDGKIEDIFFKLESGLNFLGILGLEDKVLEDTKETVWALKNAGIKFWMVSGDSEDNSLCAGVASRIFDPDLRVERLSDFSSELDCKLGMISQIRKNFLTAQVHVEENNYKTDHCQISPDDSFASMSNDKMDSKHSTHSTQLTVLPSERKHRIPIVAQIAPENLETPIFSLPIYDITGFTLSVDRSGLEFGLCSEENRKYFAVLLCAAQSVCFHSFLPRDKTKIAKFLRHNFSYNPIFLAIGDSQCDVGMIQKAHVGVGITGTRTAYSGHISIAKFSLLKELLLCHGHWFYIRASKMVLMIFFANFLLGWIMFWYTTTGHSYSYQLFGEYLIACYLFVFTLIPALAVGMWDKDLNREQISLYPQVYSTLLHNTLLSTSQFISILALALVHSFVIFFAIYCFEIINDNGSTLNLSTLEWAIYIAMTSTAAVIIFIESASFNLWTIISHFIAIILLAAFINIASIFMEEMYGNMEEFNESFLLILFVIMGQLAVVMISYGIKSWTSLFIPSLADFANMTKSKLIVRVKSKIEAFQNNLQAIYKKTKNFKESQTSFDINALTLKFTSKSREAQYMEEIKASNMKSYRLLMLSLYLLFIDFFVDSYFTVSNPDEYFPFMISIVSVYSILIITIFTKYFQQHLETLIFFTRLFNTVIVIIAKLVYATFDPIIYTNWPPLFLIGTSLLWIEMLSATILCSIITTTIVTYDFFYELDFSDAVVASLEFFILYASLIVIASLIGYVIEKWNRKRYILLKRVEIEVEKSMQVLNVVLPSFVRKRVKDGCRYIAEDQGVVTVLFCEICDFERIVSDYPHTELSYFIDDIFKKFDTVCESTGMTKIETVGKVYMACGGLNDSDAEISQVFREVSHTRRAIEMGLGLISAAKKVRLRKEKQLQVRVGIHTGPVVAGVVGFHKPQFSLVGDTVNTASRMASTIIDPDRVQISKSTYHHLEERDGLHFTKQTIDVKGKGEMKTYYVKPGEILRCKARSTTKNMFTSPIKKVSSGFQNPYNVKRSSSDFKSFTPLSAKKTSTVAPELMEVMDATDLFGKTEAKVFEPIKIFTSIFYEDEKEKEIRMQMLESNKSILFYGLLCFVLCNLSMAGIQAIHTMWFGDESFKAFLDFFFYIAEAFAYGILLVFLKINYRNKLFAWCLEVCYLLSISYSIITNLVLNNPNLEIINETYILFMILVSSQCSFTFFKNTFLFSICISIFYVISLVIIDINYLRHHILFSVFFVVIVISTTYLREKDLRVFYALEEYASSELKKTEDLLTQMMPPHVYHNLKEEVANTDTFTEVTILYADIVGFTAWSSDHNASEVVGMLSELYTRFDKKCVENNVYKVHTIGDCYVAIGLMGNDNRDPANECLNIVNFAYSLQEIIGVVNEELFLNLSMRIGIHTGKIIGGIAGTNIVRYDIYGDDVSVANKMESHGVGGSINVSEVTKNIIEKYKPGMFNFTFNKEIEIDAIKRNVKSYFINFK